MSCCHYDEGYDEGYTAGSKDRAYERSNAVETLRLLARERLIAGDAEAADFIAALAGEVEHDLGIENRVALARKREAQIVKLYAESRAAA